MGLERYRQQTGHNPDQIREALTAAGGETERPTPSSSAGPSWGKGPAERTAKVSRTRYRPTDKPLSAAGADIAATISNLGGNPDDPFAIFPQSRKLYEARAKELRNWVAWMKEEEAKWRRGKS